jgi:sugar (pentulose or hexulose) kinase
MVGSVCPAAADASGLPPGCEVRLGMTDGCAAQLAAGADLPGSFVSVVGSTLVLKGASDSLVADPAGAVYSHRHPGGWWLPGGASNVGAAALPAAFPDRDLAALDQAAAAHGPAGAVGYPLVGEGERFPFVAPHARAFILGDPADDIERYRMLLEGVAFVERLAYERLASLGAAPVGPVAAGGGGSRSLPWVRIRATVLRRPLVQVPDATTALGAAMLAAVGTLHADLQTAVQAMCRRGRVIEPDESEGDALEASYRRFMGALKDRGWLP